jgi:hypothetical protein
MLRIAIEEWRASALGIFGACLVGGPLSTLVSRTPVGERG